MKTVLILLFTIYSQLFALTPDRISAPYNDIKKGYVEFGKCKLYYEEQGEGIPVILIHGGGLNLKMWDDQFDELARHFRVIRYDARKHGASESEPDNFSHYNDLNNLMEKLNIPKAVIIGLSFGGYVAIDFTLTHPEKVIALIPVSSGLTGYNFTDKQILENQNKISQAETVEEMVEYMLRSWTDGPYRTPDKVDPKVRNKSKEMLTENITNRKAGIREQMLSPAAAGRLAEIKIPLLTIVGSLDMPDIIAIADLLVKNVQGAKKVTIKDAAHLVNMEKPKEFNETVINFISNLK
jgi:pimeloyl-ACP methyl ester carboxylesterase